MIYINKIENRITFKIKAAYFLEFSTPETIKLLGSTKSKITKHENGENLPHLEITEIVLIHCNVANNDYQQDSRFLYIFVSDKSFGQLLDDISPKKNLFLKTFNSEFSYTEEFSYIYIYIFIYFIWFTGQISKPVEIEDKINITLVTDKRSKG